ncbi:MAG: acyl carrier protein [Azoarcus sp.]|nr:acyl carrier protein [Azoarcus sp.]
MNEAITNGILVKYGTSAYLAVWIFHHGDIMGLDVVELILEVEKSFGVEIPDADAYKMQTPGDLADWVAAHVKTGKNAFCRSQARFHRLRALLMDASVPRKKIRLSVPLVALLQGKNALRDFWARLNAAPNVSRHLPHLELPSTLQTMITTINICGSFVLALILYLSVKSSEAMHFFLTWLVLYFLFLFLTYRLTDHKKTQLPQPLGDVASLLPFVEIPTSVWTRETILERIILETSGITGIPMGEISERAHFVKDLNMD